MTENTPADAAKQQQQTETAEQAQDFETTLLTALEISPYDLEVLERFLIAEKWIPVSTDEQAIKNAVYMFRKSYKSDDYRLVFRGNPRLHRLFEVWADEDIEEFVIDCGDMDPRAHFEIYLQRETAKYKGVRALFAHLAARNKRQSGNNA